MSYPRINLLKKSEQRYQGVVSRRFTVVTAMVTPILFVALFCGIKLLQYHNVHSEMVVCRDLWTDYEPRLASYKKEKRFLKSNHQILTLFKGWEDSQLPLVSLLNEIQDIVPGNIQFTRLSLRGDVSPKIYETAENMQMDYAMQIDGVSQGDRAEDEIWQMHRDLLANGVVDSIFDSVELEGMRKRQRAGEDNLREFRIVGKSKAGGEQ